MDLTVLTPEMIEAMEQVDVRTVDPATLRDIRDVKVNVNLPILLPAWEICGKDQLRRNGYHAGRPADFLHSFKMLKKRNTLDTGRILW